MLELYHFTLCPVSRKIRLLLREKTVEFQEILEKPWDIKSHIFLADPTYALPGLQVEGLGVLCGSRSIEEYIEEAYPNTRSLLGTTFAEKAEIRRLLQFFDERLAQEVSGVLLQEKLWKRLCFKGQPDSRAMNLARSHLLHHLDYIGHLAETRKWLGGNFLSLADLTAAAHLSCMDYLGDVPWHHNLEARDWYARIKCRPSFRPLLQEQVAGILPDSNYHNLDF